MLTADLVHARRRGDRLMVVPLSQAERPRALELASAYLDLARAHVGQPRGALLDACRAIDVEPREQRLARGLLKLVLDRCESEQELWHMYMQLNDAEAAFRTLKQDLSIRPVFHQTQRRVAGGVSMSACPVR